MSLLSILIASLLGSPHCAAMCGGFAGIAAHSTRPRYSLLSYHCGRLLTYLALGCLAGYFGEIINRFGLMFGISRVAAIFTGVIMIISALSMLAGRPLSLTGVLPSAVFRIPSRFVVSSSKGSSLAGVSLGLFSTLLPCGWLYTYVALAAASADALSGTIIMLVFWLGTLPILLTIGSISHLLSASLRKRVPTILAILMLSAGFFALTGHLTSFGFEEKKSLICAP